ncbi:polysaccharide deacetylase family protein [Halanaerobium hydrogeniformans]|uniref:Polysaccharide deacetylase n=1 Tax=Halanaerobium hydrogeniformans TaxID=656519 RepID=E4RMC7_HALHG|nr:polysaccharide deacetylase family protein [Halanaerobium hydrogeniformans]ADQ14458.1 polysaccharide deacetylase [Halanaerobium hydrogeniformans]
MNKRLIFFLLIIILFALIIGDSGLAAAEYPKLYNYLEGSEEFKENVERQAVKYADTFHLSARTEEKVVALTFDDGPHPSYTEKILDILDEYEIKASFFMIGNRVGRYPGLVEKVANKGHYVGNHSYNHPNLSNMKDEAVFAEEIYPTSEIIEEVTGNYPKIIRPPYGSITDSQIEYLKEENWQIINWSVDTFDWKSELNDPQQMYEEIVKHHHPGMVILMHDSSGGSGNGLEMLPQLIETLHAKGYEFVTVKDLLYLYNN